MIDKIKKSTKLEKYQLSFQQERLWYLSKIDPDNPYWNRISSISLNGEIDYIRMEQAFKKLLISHPILEAGIEVVDNEPKFYFCKEINRFNKLSLDKKSFKDLLHNLSSNPINIDKDLLFEFYIVKLSNSEHKIIFKFHHVISDASTLQIILRDLKSLYNDGSLNKNSVDYFDYIQWQRKLLLDTSKSEEYWKNKFSLQTIPKMELPQEFYTNSFDYQGNEFRVYLDKKTIKEVERLSLRRRCLPSAFYLSIFYLLLRVYVKSNDLIIGTVFSGRHYDKNLNDMIGFFINTVPLLEHINEEDIYSDFLSKVQMNLKDAYTNQDVPFDRINRIINPDRKSNESSLLNIFYNYYRNDIDNSSFTGVLNEEQIETGSFGVQADLTLEIKNYKDRAILCFQFNNSKFSLQSIERLSSHYCNLLTRVLEDPSQELYKYELMNNEEKESWFSFTSGPEVNYSKDIMIHNLFEIQVKKTPHRTALLLNGEALTYSELNKRSNRIANYLLKNITNTGDIVGICINRSFEMIELLLGILKAGCAYLPLDINNPNERLASIVQDSGMKVVLTTTKLLNKFENTNIKKIDINKESYKWSIEKTNNPALELDSDQLAYVIYTSGSTGKPKGVSINHPSVINLIQWVNKKFQVNELDRLLFTTSYCFDLSVYDIFGILASGASIRIADEEELLDPQTLYNIMVEEPITFFDSAPARLQQLVPLFSSENGSNKLRLVFLSGDWIPVTLPNNVKNTFPNANVISLGGATEASIWSNYYEINQVDPKWISIPYGKPIQNCRYYILDDNMNPCPINVPGNLYIAGHCLFKNYLNDEEKTKQKLIRDPFSDSNDLMYDTGDISRFLHDGNMEFLGRKDSQVKIRGYRVELGEIDSLLINHTDVESCVVSTFLLKNNIKQIVAYVVLKKEKELTSDDLYDFLKSYLPDYMIPAEIIITNEIPLTSNGKIDNKSLSKLVLINKSTDVKSIQMTKLQLKICHLWKEQLEVDSIGLDDDFYSIGGHSLLATKVILSMQKEFNIDLPISTLLRYSTIKTISEYINKKYKISRDIEMISTEREVGKI